MKFRYWLFTVVVCLLCLLPAAEAEANASIWFCNNGCLCVAWPTPEGERLEVRCSDGGGSAPPGYTNPVIPPTFGGSGTKPPAQTIHPGNPLPADLNFKVTNANTTAKVEAKGDKDPYSTFWIPDECSALFNSAPLHMSGYSILDGYVIYRHGEGVKDAAGNTPCSSGAAAWTSCCEHKPYVFICNAFGNLSAAEQANTLIHEALHIAGQREDGSTTVGGPSDPPNPGQIQDKVRAVCD